MEDLICQVLIPDMMIYLQSFYKDGCDKFFSPNATKQVKTDLVVFLKFYPTDNVPFDNPQN